MVGDDSNGMAKVLSAGNLTNAYSNQHSIVDITTYTRGTKRLDYVFVTPRLVDHILRSGYESFHARIGSDHRGYFVDFSLAGFWTGNYHQYSQHHQEQYEARIPAI
jgi:hypothetical protein